MKKNTFAILMMGFALSVFTACSSGDNKEAATDQQQKEHVVDTEHAYICPMHCENSASMEPGTCPVCGMDLVANPDYKGADTAAPADTAASMMQGSADEHGHDHSHEGHSH
jgi:hypothetical protein